MGSWHSGCHAGPGSQHPGWTPGAIEEHKAVLGSRCRLRPLPPPSWALGAIPVGPGHCRVWGPALQKVSLLTGLRGIPSPPPPQPLAPAPGQEVTPLPASFTPGFGWGLDFR
ncbi:Ribonuclease [Platysternon megacephalum]|uniref:Hydroxymethylglutaryl-CoA lyase n=1 Tax=Platysternon megacephalum TaxID=55544 RepID=A0A4D9DEG8_9SAUR|nr:hydroxymethylglutaryl-CoA lyase [Platysternon megacephalum]TFJ98612.1 Ribonuclease [Platysternon megacephalum]